MVRDILQSQSSGALIRCCLSDVTSNSLTTLIKIRRARYVDKQKDHNMRKQAYAEAAMPATYLIRPDSNSVRGDEAQAPEISQQSSLICNAASTQH